MRRTTISLPDELAARVQREARRRGTSVSGLLRSILEDALVGDPDEPREIAFAAICDDPGTSPGARLDDALDEEWADAIDRDRG